MSNVFTLDSLREEVDKEFAPVKVALSDGSHVVLRNLLRLSKKERDTVLEKLKNLDTDSDSFSVEQVASLVESLSSILRVVSDRPKELLKELDDDVHLMMKVLNSWMESTQPGEALNSPA